MTCTYKIVETILASNFYFLLKLFKESNISYKIFEKHLLFIHPKFVRPKYFNLFEIYF